MLETLLIAALMSAPTQAAPADTASVTILAVGDVMMGASMEPAIREHGPDHPFAGTAPAIRRADIAICNLEAPFGTKGKPFKKRFTFLVPPSYAGALKNAGFDVVAMANNHMMDYGAEPLAEAIRLLDSLGIAHSGAGRDLAAARRPAIVERKGLKVAFLSYSKVYPAEFWATAKRAGTAPGESSHVREDVAAAKKKADLVVVSFHWGAELMNTPKPYQRDLAHLSIDSGADLVLGHHPHILQGMEIYKGKLIAYSLGNFAFGSRSRKCTESVMLEVRLARTGTGEARIIPVCVDNLKTGFQPAIVSGPEGRAILGNLRRISKPLGFDFEPADSVATIRF
jgi:poly-gamma-glutamate synthesis protein (capsule biosynthesis protein)